MDSADKRAYCFQRVLAINPNNPDAKKQLALLSPPKPVSTTQAFHNPEPPAPEEKRSVEELRKELPQAQIQAHPPVAKATVQVSARKKNNNVVFFSIAGGLCILTLALAAAFMMLAGNFGKPVNPSPAQVSTSTMPALADETPVGTSEAAAPTQLPTPMPTVAYTPNFEETDCPFEAPIGAEVTCGYAIVPENRTADNGRTLRLLVTVFHSTSPNPAPDPVIFLQGGPGGQAVQLVTSSFPIFVEPFLGERDYITFDQRGTGFSQPEMDCEELDKIQRQDIYGNLTFDTRELAYQNAVQDCSGFLRAQGFDLTAYSTVESAADLRDIVKLLGYDKVNLYGASYGTRLALVTMRNHPEIVRSAVLDSVVPVETNLLLEIPESANSALSRMFALCAADSECNAAYPELEKTFWDLLAELDANPVTLTTSAYPIGTVTETMDGAYLFSVVTRLLKISELIHTAPQTIFRVRNGDYTTLALAQYLLPYEFDSISQGLYISMMCREQVLTTTEEELNLAAEEIGAKNYVFRPFYGNFGKMFSACRSWGAEGPDLGEMDAVSSDIPSLVIEGSFDPTTPPMFGKQVAEKLPNSYYFEFPNQGHVPTGSDLTGCAEDVVLNFLRAPLSEPDRSCLDELPETKFLVPYTGEPAPTLKTETLNNVSLKVPADWTLTLDGVLYRNNSIFDVTQAAAFRAPITIQDLTTYFSSFAFYLAFDNSPVPAGTRDVNGRRWNLYTTTSRKYPVDVAVSDPNSRGESIFIVLYSHADERDAVYRTIFLPMVDSAK